MRIFRLLTHFCLVLTVSTVVSAGVIGGTDVRIGTDTGARSAIFDFDPDTGNYYAVVVWEVSWTFNISTDGGTTWSSFYRSTATQGIAGIDMAVGHSYVYVGYVANQTADEALMRRFFAATGQLDTTYRDNPFSASRTIFDASPETVTAVAIDSDVDSNNLEVFYALTVSDGTARFFSDDSSVGTMDTEVALGSLGAVGGLDMHWNPGAAAHSLFLSLVDETGDIQVWRYDGAWSLATSFPYAGSQVRSAISAFGDHVAVAYLAPAAHGQGVRYRQSSDGGDTWGPGTFIAEPAVGQGDFLDVDITARGGLGLAVVYNLKAGDVDWSLFQYKPDYDSGAWTGANWFNDFDSVTGLPITLNWTPSDLYGAIYVGDTDDFSLFDLLDPDSIFVDGFESGDASGWSGTAPPP